MTDVAEGREQASTFMAAAISRLHEVIGAIKEADPPPVTAAKRPDTPVLGQCPVCQTPVREQRGTFSCETGRECAFVVFKRMTGRVISVRMVKSLLKNGHTDYVKGWKSKAGNTFEAGLEIRQDGTVGLRFKPRDGDRPASSSKKPSERPALSAHPGAADPVGMACPQCRQGRIVKGRTAWGCNRYREGCHFVIGFEVDGRPLSPADAVAQIEGRR